MKNLFSGRLYGEGMRRLLLPGIISLVLMTALQTAAAAGFPLNLTTFIGNSWDTPNARQLFEAVATYLPGVILPFLFVAVAFGFLHRREGSDFYHALAVPRAAQCLSLWLAAMTWVVLAAVTAVLVALLLSWIDLLYGALYWSELGMVLALLLTLALLSAGASLLAVCLTGTRFTAAGVTAIILLLPRLWVGSFVYLLWAHLPLLGSDAVPALRLNLLSDTLVGSMLSTISGIREYREITYVLGSFLYTGGLGLVYAGLGVWAYCRRKSEIAGRAVPNRFLQGVYRISLALLFCAPACLILLTRTSWMAKAAAFYLLAVLVYFGFELLTTRRLKNLVKALPGLAVVAAINLLFIGGYRLVADRVLAFTPQAEDITSVRFLEEEPLHRGWGDGSDPDWFTHKLKEIGFEEQEARKLVSRALQRGANLLTTGQMPEGTPHRVEILCAGKSRERTLYLSWQEEVRLEEIFLANEQVRRLYTELPDPGLGVTLDCFGQYFDGETTRELYALFRQEIRQTEPEKWVQFLRRSNREINYDSPLWGQVLVHLTVQEQGEKYGLWLYLPSFCRETYTAYLNADTGSRAALLAFLQAEDLEGMTLRCEIQGPSDKSMLADTLTFDPTDPGRGWEKLTQLRDCLADGPLDLDGIMAHLSVYDRQDMVKYDAYFMLKELPRFIKEKYLWMDD